MARRKSVQDGESANALKRQVQRRLDEALDDTFPASDPVSFLQAVPVKQGDEPLCTVKVNGMKATTRARRMAKAP